MLEILDKYSIQTINKHAIAPFSTVAYQNIWLKRERERERERERGREGGREAGGRKGGGGGGSEPVYQSSHGGGVSLYLGPVRV